MTRYERKLFFERLMALRETYRTEEHEPTTMTIAEAMTFAEAELDKPAPAAAETADTAVTTDSAKTGPSTTV
jgi:hypothetical protein